MIQRMGADAPPWLCLTGPNYRPGGGVEQRSYSKKAKLEDEDAGIEAQPIIECKQ